MLSLTILPCEMPISAAIIADSDNLICYSKFETFGVPIIEAWASGLTVTATTTAAAIIDHFNEQLGVKVSPDDLDGLKHALRFVYGHRSEYDRDYIVQFVAHRFSEEEVCHRLIGIYKG